MGESKKIGQIDISRHNSGQINIKVNGYPGGGKGKAVSNSEAAKKLSNGYTVQKWIGG